LEEASVTASSAENRLVGKKTAPVPGQTGQPWPADAVERRSVAALVPCVRNARVHSPEQVAQLAASIREWGWTAAILVNEQDHIVAGHGRLLAAQQLGLTEVPVMVARGWTEAQIQAYRLANNRLALNATWDENLLRLEMGELKGLGADLSLTGFGELELDALFVSTDGNTDADEAPDLPAVPVSRLGDLWICGEHRILCGDATDLADVKNVLAGELADMCFTDPPYGVNYSAKDKQRGKTPAAIE
jgi:ParB-like nuclease family protein